MKKISLALFLLIVLSSAFMNSYNHYGDIVEKVIAFIIPLLNYIVVIALFAKFKGAALFTKLQLRVIAILYVMIVFVEYGYPIFEYSEQTLPSDYLFNLSLQFVLNVIIARTILDE
ncbi:MULTISPECIES: hypothetical protein [Vibrio]|uniref:Uncharacterized protein n=1 Tax=Vibrio neptunius TaxID=170651 RepID=A0ABS3A266_9VIBR|nr:MULTISPECIES: hypothetical protein [Vibrio]MBN3493687.1 hypothetical protein [Vibrio neptunius]MBN3516082.1 hypothetical protein [Vibrio neptunius]MBN3550454.1 hypothetical protein [Vibrio neptunius]MBN3578488.1 hypothetical protein [Vibrio neptunius]MCH9872152.1 hypothetical protein [Vibrio neptunius]